MSAAARGSRPKGRLTAALLAAVTLVTCLWSYAAPAHALPAPQATTCAGVWVVVDFGALGGTSTACAASYSTGMDALRKAGFTPTLDSGLVVKINALPAVPNIQENYWSYWHATRQADGSYSGWSYANSGPSAFQPTAIDAEGWRYESISGGKVAPGVTPPKQTVITQAPQTTAPATTTRTTAAATKGATTAAAGQTGLATTSAPGSPAASTSAADSTSATTTPAAIDSRTVGATLAPPAPTSTSTSSLFGGVIAILVIAAGAGGVLLWRKRTAAKAS